MSHQSQYEYISGLRKDAKLGLYFNRQTSCISWDIILIIVVKLAIYTIFYLHCSDLQIFTFQYHIYIKQAI